jgi:hypothetical protein
MPIINPPLLSNKELLDVFMQESKRFMEGLKNDLPYNQLNEIYQNLKRVSRELDTRRNRGELKDC